MKGLKSGDDLHWRGLKVLMHCDPFVNRFVSSIMKLCPKLGLNQTFVVLLKWPLRGSKWERDLMWFNLHLFVILLRMSYISFNVCTWFWKDPPGDTISTLCFIQSYSKVYVSHWRVSLAYSGPSRFPFPLDPLPYSYRFHLPTLRELIVVHHIDFPTHQYEIQTRWEAITIHYSFGLTTDVNLVHANCSTSFSPPPFHSQSQLFPF